MAFPKRAGDLGCRHIAGHVKPWVPRLECVELGAGEGVQQRTQATVDGPRSLGAGGASQMTTDPRALKRRWSLWDKSSEKSPGGPLPQRRGSHPLAPSSLSPS